MRALIAVITLTSRAVSALIEDAQQPLPSYQQFLTQIKDKVNGVSSS